MSTSRPFTSATAAYERMPSCDQSFARSFNTVMRAPGSILSRPQAASAAARSGLTPTPASIHHCAPLNSVMAAIGVWQMRAAASATYW